MDQATRALAYSVRQMRLAQNEYFNAAAVATKSKQGSDFAKKAMRLKEAKSLETVVDQEVAKILAS